MRQPGHRLRAFAARFCGPRTMERLIDTVIADLQAEHAMAVARGGRWKQRWVLLRAYVAFAKVLLIAGLVDIWRTFGPWSPIEAAALRRTAFVFSVATVVATLLLVLTPGRITTDANRGLLTLLYLPAVLPIGVSFGITFVILCGLKREAVSSHIVLAVVVASAVCSTAMLADMVLVVPESNQAYRELAFGGPVPRGDREMSMRELQPIVRLRPDNARRFEITYHTRKARAAAPLAMMGVSLLLVARRKRSRIATLAVATLICVAYWSLLLLAEELGIWTMIPPVLTVWTPNIAFAILAAGLAWRYRSTTPTYC